MTSLRTNTNNGSSGSSSSASPSPMTPVIEITRLRTPTPSTSSAAIAALPLTATVKREEVVNEEIKEFAETAMNEMLGWYGYGNENAPKRNGLPGHHRERAADDAEGVPGRTTSGMSITKKDPMPRNRQQPRGHGSINDRMQPGGVHSPHSLSNSPGRTSPVVSNENNLVRSCDWCHRNINPEEMETFSGTTEGVRFCSEPCFAQSRRATFKRAKTCDWCRHVRHAVSYVDFQDGASQLQFCSDKCLNQYKMQIFIKETQAHLEMNPHLMDKGEGSGGSLITPELWLKNCRSRSASPEQQQDGNRSRSASPPRVIEQGSKGFPRRSDMDVDANLPRSVINRPTITVAPVSKLLQPPMTTLSSSSSSQGCPATTTTTTAELMANRPSMKTMRKRRTLRNGPPVTDNQTQLPNYHQEETNKQGPLYHQISPGNQMHHDQGSSRSNGQPQMNHMNQFDPRFLSPPPNLFPIRHNPVPSSPQMFRSPVSENNSLPPLPNLRPSPMPREAHTQPQYFNPGQFMMGASQIPPVTILVPCPIILPIPVPIPIPINIPEFLLKLLAATSANPGSSSSAGTKRESGASEENVGTRAAQDNDLNNNKTPLSNSGVNYSMDSNMSSGRSSQKDVEHQHESDSEGSDNAESCEVVPKIKITRLQSKRILTSKELDSTRPLRKRKRIVVDAYT